MLESSAGLPAAAYRERAGVLPNASGEQARLPDEKESREQAVGRALENN